MSNIIWATIMIFCIFTNVYMLTIDFCNPLGWIALSLCSVALIMHLITLCKKIINNEL